MPPAERGGGPLPAGAVPSSSSPALADRAQRWDALLRGPFDLLVVGGGITGAGVAAAASQRGWKVALVEREDFGSGTSGATSKMLHGGLRYLQQGNLGLVREALHERGRLLQELGASRVQLTPFLLPLRGSALKRLELRWGTWMYQRLAGKLSLGPREVLSREEVHRRAPLLTLEGLKGGVVYLEGVVDDSLLTLVRVQEAIARGAVALNHVEALAPVPGQGPVQGVRLRDRLRGVDGEAQARQVVNAAGVWSRGWAGEARTPALRPSKGVHLVFRRSRLPLEVAIVLPAPAGRWVFALPYGPLTIVGTTDTDHPGSPDEVRAEPADVRYLLEVANEAFPALKLSASDVVDVYAGLRPLLAGDAERPSDLSRDDVVHREPGGLLTVVGGKLTTHRAMAERALREATPPASSPAPTGATLPALPFPPKWSGTPCPGAEFLESVLASPRSGWSQQLRPWVDSAISTSGAATMRDLLDRRFHALQRMDPAFPDLVGEVGRLAAPLLGWSAGDLQVALDGYLEGVRSHTRAVADLRGKGGA